MDFVQTSDGFTLAWRGRIVIRHSARHPWLSIGRGEDTITGQRGNFQIEDHLVEKIPLPTIDISRREETLHLAFRRHLADEAPLLLDLRNDRDEVTVSFLNRPLGVNRLWIRLEATPDEHVWGAGEQFSHFNLRGRHFPIWTRESGVGRDKASLLTFHADRLAGAGGDYHTTYYPQPSFLSSRHYAFHLETTAYADLDFRRSEFHEVEVWSIPVAIHLLAADDLIGVVEALSGHFGRPPALPAWVNTGVILGLKQGEETAFRLLDRVREHGVKVAALWCEDWVGLRVTSFGKRLFWDWRWNAERYPTLVHTLRRLKAEGVRFLGYVNPYLCTDGSLFPEARDRGYLVKNAKDEPYLVDFGEFDAGMVDLTSEAATEWFKATVIKTNMLDFGLDGWMADFGEYLPADARLANGIDAREMHNAWPVLWAAANAEAIDEAGRQDDVLFFMRSGYAGIQPHCRLLWAGDQSVDFSRHDGMPSVVCAALSSGLQGNPFHHSDIGGYTSLFSNVRTAELFQRWAEMAAFTAVMRTHEGNRPDENFQVYQDDAVLAHFARMSALYVALTPYRQSLIREAVARGLPLQRPLFLHFEQDEATFDIQTTYLLGSDLLVAPVLQAGVTEWNVYLPNGVTWHHLWSDAPFAGSQTVTISAPLGFPPVFYREDSPSAPLFRTLPALA